MMSKSNSIEDFYFLHHNKKFTLYHIENNGKITTNFFGFEKNNKLYYFNVNNTPHYNTQKTPIQNALDFLRNTTEDKFFEFLYEQTSKSKSSTGSKSYNEVKDNIQSILEANDYDIIALLEKFGFRYNAKKSPSNALEMIDNKQCKNVVFQRQGVDNEVLLMYNNKNVFYFKNSIYQESNFQGNVFNLVNFYHFQNEDYSNKSYFMQSYSFMNDFIAQKHTRTLESPEKRKPKTLTPEDKVKIYSEELTYPIYLVSRGILPTTLQHPCYKSLIVNSHFETTPFVQSAAFVLRDKQLAISSYLEKNLNWQHFPSDKSTIGLLFLSHFEKPNKLLISETCIDLMSYAQETKQLSKQIAQASFFGQINEKQIEFLLKIIEENGIRELDIINDNDLYGYRYEFLIYRGLITSLDNDPKSHIIETLSAYESQRLSMRKENYIEYAHILKSELTSKFGFKIQSPKNTSYKDFNDELCDRLGLKGKQIFSTESTPKLKELLFLEKNTPSIADFYREVFQQYKPVLPSPKTNLQKL